MRYWGCTLVGLAIFAVSLYGFNDSLTTLLDTGTCASGNTPYAIERECPDGTGSTMLIMMGSVFGFLLALGIVALRGSRPGGGGRGVGPLLSGWALFFSVTGGVALIHSLSSETIPADGELGGTIVGIIFLFLGLPVLGFVLWRFFAALR